MKRAELIIIYIFLFIALIMPTDQALIQYIKNLENRLTNIENTRQPYISDWREISEPISYSSSTQISIDNTDVDASVYFPVGNKVRLKQGGGYKYFYVTSTSANLVNLTGGSDYTVANSAITDLASSNVPKPSGHPILLGFSSILVMTDAGSITQGTFVGKFYLNANIVTATYVRNNWQLPVTTPVTEVYEQLPLVRSVSTSRISSNGLGQSATDLQYSIGINAPFVIVAPSIDDTLYVEVMKLPIAAMRQGENLQHYFTIRYVI